LRVTGRAVADGKRQFDQLVMDRIVQHGVHFQPSDFKPFTTQFSRVWRMRCIIL
jgi:hypothetical protein